MADERDGTVSDATPERVLDRLTDGVFGLDTDWQFTVPGDAAAKTDGFINGPPFVGTAALGWCSPANHVGLSSRRPGFESLTEHFSPGCE